MRHPAAALACALVASAVLHGAGQRPPGAPPAIGTAYIFVTTDCPIANRYAPEIQRLHAAYSRRGIAFRLVYVNPRDGENAIAAHTRKFNYTIETVRDPRHALVNQFGITVTPEAALVDTRGRLLYRGRIDDRYVDVGVDRQQASTHDLREALEATLAGRPIAAAATRAVGCFVADLAPPTFARDIAPVLFDKCVTCHRAGGAAPFSLATYADARQRASLIAAVTERRFMPPYNATSDEGAFHGQKRLTAAEIALLRQWADSGAPEGPRELTPAPPRLTDGWQLGTPDLVVTATPFMLQAEASDVFRIFAIPVPIATPKYVTGIEFHPGNAKVVHHANIRLDPTPGSRELDARDPAPGYDGLLARSAIYPDGHFLGWTPGQIAPLVPPALAWRLDPGTDLVVQLHMQPSGAAEAVQPSIGFFFSDTPPTHTPTILRLGSQGIDIPPGDGRFVVRDSYVLPVDVELHALQPHAHYRLREAVGTATLPDGSIRTLIEIGSWDFRWQHVYRFERPVPLPKGTRVAMEYRYDNSAANPRNPQLPPQRVFWGQRSFDEMGDLWFQFVTRGDTERQLLNAQILTKMTAEDVIGYETMLRADPRDAELHDDVAVLYLALGRAGEAVAHFERSVALKPADPAARFNLATALTMQGRLRDAIDAHRHALRLRPDYAAAHNNLGTVLATQGRVAEALPHFRDAIRYDAANVQAHRNIAWYVATWSGRTPPLVQEALAAGEAAARLTAHRDPHVLEALAAAYRAAGREADAAQLDRAVRRLRQ